MTTSVQQLVRFVALLLAGAGAATGCGGSTASGPPAIAASPQEQEATAGLVEHHRHHHHGGVTLLIAMSLDTIAVSPEQRAALEKIRTDLHAQMEPARKAEQSLVNALADELAAGALDPAKLDAALGQLTGASATVHGASIDALNQLHAVLTPPQRAVLVDKLVAHWSVWQKANGEDGDHLTYLSAELGLAQYQVDKIRASLADAMKAVPRFDPQEVTAHIQAFGEAFEAPTFDAKTLTAGDAATSHMVGWGAARMVRFFEAVSPVLTPEQRTKLVETLRMHANHDPSGQGG
jgi:Spy/CpxP family protein refolding chaperone